MADDGFHEIQLNGKQLVALFMGAAVVLVVAFLLGAQVGRGVRNAKDGAPAADAAAQVPPPAADVQPAATATPQAGAPAGAPAGEPAKPVEADLSYPARLDGQAPAAGAKPVAVSTETATKAAVPAEKVAAKDQPAATKVQDAAAPAGSKPEAAGTAPGDPAGAGYIVKVAAYKDRGGADAVAARLVEKGYAAYVVPSSAKGAAVYSVRVGKFKTRKEADAVRVRLEKEEKFKPLVTR